MRNEWLPSIVTVQISAGRVMSGTNVGSESLECFLRFPSAIWRNSGQGCRAAGFWKIVVMDFLGKDPDWICWEPTRLPACWRSLIDRLTQYQGDHRMSVGRRL